MAKKSVKVNILVDESHHDKMDEVTKDLEDKGFVLNQSLGAVGVLTGSAPSAAISKLSAVAGVSAVEPEQTDYRPQGGS